MSKKKLNITLLGKTPTKKCVKIRVDISELSTHLAPLIFYNQRLLNQFKRLLRDKGIDYVYYKKFSAVVVERFYLVVIAQGDGRFKAYNKANRHTASHLYGKRFDYSATFEANSTIELINKLLRFNIIGHGSAVHMVEEKTLPRPKSKKPPSIEVLTKGIPIFEL